MNRLIIYTILLLLGSVYYSESVGAERLADSYPNTPGRGQELSAETHTALLRTMKEPLSRIQSPFIKNEGQIKSDVVKFYVQTFNGTVFITDKGELFYTILNTKDYLGAEDYLLPDGSFSGRYVFSLKETPLTDKLPQINGLESSPTTVNYFIGDNPKGWRSNIQSYNTITLGEVWKGVTINLKANSKNIEKLFVINPDGNPESIRFSVDGTEELLLTPSGEIKLGARNKSIGFTHPIAYQEINGDRKSVDVSFRLIDKNTYGFIVGDYNHDIPLVIDPLLSSTFIGGFGADVARAVAIDPTNGNVFVAGYSNGTGSTNNFPSQGQAPLAPYDATWNTGNDVVVCKLNPTLSTLIASTYLGGAGSDGAYGIALDSQGNVFVAGFAGSGFPVSATAFDTSYNGPSGSGSSANPNDAFVSKLSNSLNALLASTYLGGSATDTTIAEACTGIAIDDTDNVFVCGYTDGANFRATGGPTYPGGASSVNYNGGGDAFLCKFNNNLSGPSGEEFYFAGVFLGGSGSDAALGITINSFDDQDNIYVVGYTTIGDPFFPVVGDGLVDAYDRAIDSSGLSDAFISRFSNDLRTLRSSTYLGAVGPDIGYSITMGPPSGGQATIYVTGTTDSPLFPVTTPIPDWNPYGTTQPGLGSQDIFISRLLGNLTDIVNSTWIGGVDTETVYSICTGGSNNNVYICGTTGSSDFPTTEYAFDAGGAGDVFVCSFNETLSILNASTMIGGQFLDTAYCIRPDNTGNIIFTGDTNDTLYPTWPTTGTDIAYDTAYNGSGDIFVTRITNDLSNGLSEQQQPTPPEEEGIYDEGEGIIAGSSSLAYLDANAFRQSCFIATAAYGNPMHPNVITLRSFRDKYLLTNKLGSRFVDWYYRTSPPVAEYLKHTPLQASAVRYALAPIVYTIRHPILIPLIGGLLLALCYWIKRRYARQHPAS